MSRSMRSLVIGAALFGILALSIYYAAVTWVDLGEVALGWFGWLMLLLGSLMALALGGGLMTLVFLSARRGHDDAHHHQSVFRRPTPDASDRDEPPARRP